MQGGPYATLNMTRTHEAANGVHSMKFNGKIVSVYRMLHNHLSLQVSSLFNVRMYRAIAVDAVLFLCSCTHTMCSNYGIIMIRLIGVRLSLFSFQPQRRCPQYARTYLLIYFLAAFIRRMLCETNQHSKVLLFRALILVPTRFHARR